MSEPGKLSVGDILFRAEVGRHSRDVVFSEWIIVKLTEHGAWLVNSPTKSVKWSKRTKNGTRFARATKLNALEHLVNRMESWIAHIERRSNVAHRSMHIAREAFRDALKAEGREIHRWLLDT